MASQAPPPVMAAAPAAAPAATAAPKEDNKKAQTPNRNTGRGRGGRGRGNQGRGNQGRGRGRDGGRGGPVSVAPNTGIPYGHVPGYLPGSSSLVEELEKRILIVLRDGRHIVGVSRLLQTFL